MKIPTSIKFVEGVEYVCRDGSIITLRRICGDIGLFGDVDPRGFVYVSESKNGNYVVAGILDDDVENFKHDKDIAGLLQ